MIDRESQINKIFMRIAFFKLFFLGTEIGLLYSLFKNQTELCLCIIAMILVVFITLFINLWEAINEERINNDR